MMQTTSPGGLSASLSPPRSHHRGMTPVLHHRPGPGRACDRCRRRKSRCDFTEADARCSNCRVGGLSCTFILPLGKRGPKAPHSSSRSHRRLSSTASPPQSRQTQSETETGTQAQAEAQAQPQSHTPPVASLPFLDGSIGGSLGPGPTDLMFSAIGWEPAAVETGYASASVPAAPVVATTSMAHTHAHPHEAVLSPPRVMGGAGAERVESTSMLVRITQIQRRWQELSQTLTMRYPNPGTTGRDIASRSLSLFLEYLYPLTPLVHKASLYRALALLEGDNTAFALPGSESVTWPPPPPPPPPDDLDTSLDTSLLSMHPSPSTTSEVPLMQPEEAFTLVTAVCAEAAFMLPAAVYAEGRSVGDAFLEASRSCLNSYLETDLEAPNANSIIIRYFHSNCLHGAGRPKYSWHIFGEATRLIQAMGLHDAGLLAGLPPLEAEMRRRAFWIVYMGDKSAAILNGRPITIHRFSFDSNITLPYPTSLEDDLVGNGGGENIQPASCVSGAQQRTTATSTAGGDATTPRSCIVGFNANLELWQVASQLLLEIRVQKEKEAKQAQAQGQAQAQAQAQTHTQTQSQTPLTTSPAEQRRYFYALYVAFVTELDRLPAFLQPWQPTSSSPDTQSSFFMGQTVNLFVSFYCLRVVILQNLQQLACFQEASSLAEIESVDLRTTEIVRDMLRLLHDAPFWALQVNGEPLVEKIRLLGGSLLAIIHGHEQRNEASVPLAQRARADFSVLYNILSRLDSRASDALKTNSAAAV